MTFSATRQLLPAILAALFAGATPSVTAQTSYSQETATSDATRSGGTSAAGTPATNGKGRAASSGSSADTATDDVAIQNLQAAAQSLREAVQRMAQTPAGEQRTEAMRESNEALIQVQAAMAALPPDLLTANVRESDYKKSMDKLKQASDRLHVAANALANQPPGKGRDAAIKKVNQALLETNEAMLTGLQLSASNAKGNAASASSGSSGGSGASSASSGENKGSAAVTGRPGGNTVDLTNSPDAGRPGSSGNASSGAAAGSGSTSADK